MLARTNVIIKFCRLVETGEGDEFTIEKKWDINEAQPQAKIPLCSLHLLLSHSAETLKFKELIFDESKAINENGTMENLIPLNDENMKVIKDLQPIKLARLTFKLSWIQKFAIRANEVFDKNAYMQIIWKAKN